MADLNSTLVKGNLRVTSDAQVSGSISEGGTALSDKYLGKSDKAADSSKLNGHAVGDVVGNVTLNSYDSQNSGETRIPYLHKVSFTNGVLTLSTKYMDVSVTKLS